MKNLFENWKRYLAEDKEVVMFPARYLKSYMGEYRTEPHWKNFFKLNDEEKREWAETVSLDEPVDITVFMDGTFAHGDGHHRVMAGKILNARVPIIITRNHIKNKAEPGTWDIWWELVSQGNDPSKLNPEGYLLKSIGRIKELENEIIN
jgi:hypothetical protein